MTGRAPTAVLETLLRHADRDGSAGATLLARVDPHDLVDAAAHEYVVPLAARALQAAAPGGAHAAAMRTAAAAWTLREAAERRAIVEFLDAARGVPLVFIKGASMAYGVYDTPALRMKEDWDVVAEPGAHAAAAEALRAAGFAPDPSSKPGRVRMRQQTYRRDVAGSQCIVDLHARTLNPPALAERIPFADLASRSVALPALHSSARGLGEDAALVLACVHRLAHHSGEPRLAWDYDILLLARRAKAETLTRVAALAGEWGAGAFVATEVRRVFERFAEPMPAAVRVMVSSIDAGAGGAEAFLQPDRSRAREFMLDWRVLGWRDRGALIAETLLPDPAFVRASRGSTVPLPIAYLLRVVRGVRGWFRPH